MSRPTIAIDVMRKLRTLAIRAHQKIWFRRNDPRPGKWPDDGKDGAGNRDWLQCEPFFLRTKLQEEVDELKDAVMYLEDATDVLAEAGDVSAMAMMNADRASAFKPSLIAPRIVVICGSTKFKEEHFKAAFEETMKGNITLGVAWSHPTEMYQATPFEKDLLDELHLRRIDLADEILVVNYQGYIGDSTRREIEYALGTGKTVRYRFPFKSLEDTSPHWPFPD